jgi:hypothetical protein
MKLSLYFLQDIKINIIYRRLAMRATHVVFEWISILCMCFFALWIFEIVLGLNDIAMDYWLCLLRWFLK